MKRLLLTIAVVVPLVLLIFAFSPRAQNTKHLTFEVAFAQKSAPVQMRSVTHSLDFLYASAEVTNVSDQMIRAITFGVLAHDIGPDWNKPVLVSSRQIATNIKATETRALDIEDVSPSYVQGKASELKSSSVGVEFGILSVQFADGTTWDYDWRASGAFDPRNMFGPQHASVKTVQGCKASTASTILATLSRSSLVPGILVVLAQSYTCGTTTDKEYCTNNLTSKLSQF